MGEKQEVNVPGSSKVGAIGEAANLNGSVLKNHTKGKRTEEGIAHNSSGGVKDLTVEMVAWSYWKSAIWRREGGGLLVTDCKLPND